MPTRLVDPKRCWGHMPIKHCDVLAAYVRSLPDDARPQRRERISAAASTEIDSAPLAGVDYPACWDWPQGAARKSIMTLLGNKEAVWGLFRDWHQNRCAICGALSDAELLRDHDHVSGLIRGLLCRRCNVREGKSRTQLAAILDYRQHNPASILGIELEYTLVQGKGVSGSSLQRLFSKGSPLEFRLVPPGDDGPAQLAVPGPRGQLTGEAVDVGDLKPSKTPRYRAASSTGAVHKMWNVVDGTSL